MPTEKPRVTITMSQEQFDKVDSFRFGKKMKNQTQAILALIESGLSELCEESECGAKKAPSLSDEALVVAHKYDVLDSYGKDAVSAVLKVEYSRCTAPSDIGLVARGGVTVKPTREASREELERFVNETQEIADKNNERF